MLVLSRQLGDQIVIGNNIVVTVLEVRGDRVQIGVSAPSTVPVHRREIFERIQKERGGAGPDAAPPFLAECA